MSISRSCPLLLVGLALGACASPGVEPSQPTAPPSPTTDVELRQAPEHAAAPTEPTKPTEPTESEEQSQEDHAELGMIGLLNPGTEGEGGLGLAGISNGEGIGLGSIGTIGGPPAQPTAAPKAAASPRVRMGATQVSGRLPPEVIQRIVRQNFGRFRHCYSKGLQKDPNLQGKVVVQFVIARDGSVSSAQASGSMPDASVVSCVSGAFRALTFPQPEGGIVTVKYPIIFKPGTSSGGVTPPSIAGVELTKATAADVYKALESAKCTVISSTTIGGATKFLVKRAGHTFTITFVPASTGANVLSKEAKAKLASAAVRREGAALLAVKSNDRSAAAALLGDLVP